jgi:hypothetical protein
VRESARERDELHRIITTRNIRKDLQRLQMTNETIGIEKTSTLYFMLFHSKPNIYPNTAASPGQEERIGQLA